RSDRDWSSDVCSSDLARRYRHPQVLADVAVENEARNMRRAYQDVGAERHRRAEQLDGVVARVRRRPKPAQLVELAVIRWIRLRRSEERRVGKESRPRW